MKVLYFSRNIVQTGNAAYWRLLQKRVDDLPRGPLPTFPPLEIPSSSPSPSLVPSTSLDAYGSPPSLSVPTVSPAENPSTRKNDSSSKHHQAFKLALVIGGPVLFLVLVIGVIFCRGIKVVAIRPWATGLSGQLQQAFVTGKFSFSQEQYQFCVSSSEDIYKGKT